MNITAISIFNQELTSKETPEHVSLNKSCNPQIKQIEVQTINGRIYDPRCRTSPLVWHAHKQKTLNKKQYPLKK